MEWEMAKPPYPSHTWPSQWTMNEEMKSQRGKNFGND
jgi:hypothetical protein